MTHADFPVTSESKDKMSRPLLSFAFVSTLMVLVLVPTLGTLLTTVTPALGFLSALSLSLWLLSTLLLVSISIRGALGCLTLLRLLCGLCRLLILLLAPGGDLSLWCLLLHLHWWCLLLIIILVILIIVLVDRLVVPA